MRCGIVLAGFLAVLPLAAADETEILGPPREGRIYHGVYPGGRTGEEDDVKREDLTAYEEAVLRRAAWVYISNNWYRSREFPRGAAEWIRESGAVPYVRLMLRSDAEQNHAEPVFHVRAILDGDFDRDLAAWARGARDLGTPVLAEWGTEVNGEWFSWNGKWNGGADGPERFAAAYRRVVGIAREEGARNVSWVFHVNAHDWPDEDWNRLENYYPGDDVMEWIAVSAYGPQTPMDREAQSLREMLDPALERIGRMAPEKPVILAEFGCTRGSPAAEPGPWTRSALADLLGNRWPAIRGFSWWNEEWPNDDDRDHDTNMQVQDVPAIRRAFRDAFEAHPDRIEERPVLSRR